jgi:hypothetical protein
MSSKIGLGDIAILWVSNNLCLCEQSELSSKAINTHQSPKIPHKNARKEPTLNMQEKT